MPTQSKSKRRASETPGKTKHKKGNVITGHTLGEESALSLKSTEVLASGERQGAWQLRAGWRPWLRLARG